WRSASDRRESAKPPKPMEALLAVYKHEDRMEQAEAVAREALGLARALPQQGDFGRIAKDWCDDLIYVLTQLGKVDPSKVDEAIAREGEEVEILRRTRGDLHHSTLKALNGLAWALFEAGRYSEAESPAREAVSGYQRAARPNEVDRINTLDTLAMVLLALDQP